MLSKKFQQKIYETYKENHDATTKHGGYEYSIAYNATCCIHTWIIRRKPNETWHWLQPLDEDIK